MPKDERQELLRESLRPLLFTAALFGFPLAATVADYAVDYGDTVSIAYRLVIAVLSGCAFILCFVKNRSLIPWMHILLLLCLWCLLAGTMFKCFEFGEIATEHSRLK